jgi:pumilio RNA-binding family
MDPSAPTSQSTRDANLATLFQDVMRLGEPSPPERERHAALAPPPSPGQQLDQRCAAMLAEMASLPPALQHRTSPMMQELQTARQFWPQPAYYPWPWEEMGSSSRAPIGAAINGFVGGYVPTQSPSPYQPVAASSVYTLNASASQYQPAPLAGSTSLQYKPAPLASSNSLQYPQYQPAPLVSSTSLQYPQFQPAPLASSSSLQYPQYQPAPLASNTSLQYPQHSPLANQTVSSVPDYASSITHRLTAIRAQAPAVRRCRTLDETRSELLRGDMELQLVTFPDSAAHVVRLLEEEGREDCERIRQSVLAGATRRVHDFMDNREGQEVLAALLRACAGRYAEVRAIVEAAAVAHNPNGRHSLLRLAKHDHG